jgi:putative addiction module component (TIGR02574 family)
MHGADEIISEASALPIEERIKVVDSLLRTINAPDPDIDKAWIAVSERRVEELLSGKVAPVPGEEVFARIRERFSR